MDKMIGAILKELELRKNYLNQSIDTIYFGGGTPSLLSSSNLGLIIEQIGKYYKVNPNSEITLEANPEDINSAMLKEVKRLGINRMSLGVQSFDDLILKSLNRGHTKKEAIDAIRSIQDSGIRNISIDLIYGIPGQEFSLWQENLSHALELNLPHLSCYALTIEEKTAFGQWQKIGKLKSVSDITYEKDYSYMCSYLSENHYEHYEVSSFALEGMMSRHNSSYWQQEGYLGVGPGAHSYNKESRLYNISNNAGYIRSIESGILPSQQEVLTRDQLYNEHLLTGLRTSKGLIVSEITDKFNIDINDKHGSFLAQCKQNKLAHYDKEKFILTDKGLILADSIIIELMIDLE